VDSNVTAGQVDFWVQKSTDGGDTFSDWWGRAAGPVTSLKGGGSEEIAYDAPAKDTHTFNAGDIFLIKMATNGTWSGGRYFYAQLVVEC
jgi:hypothetical protein